MRTEPNKIKIKLTLIFWINAIALICTALWLVYHVGIDGRSTTEQDFVMERFGIIFAIIIIPFSLKIFHNRYNKIPKDEPSIFSNKVYKLFNLRLLALDAVIIFNFIGFYFIGALNFIYIAGITIIVFALCYPLESIINPQMVEIEEEIIDDQQQENEL